MSPFLSVVVCTYNRASVLAGCLISLENQTLDKSKFEVIVVNNNSSDNTIELVNSFIAKNNNFRIVIEYNQGIRYARSRGWREAQGNYVAYIDDDTKCLEDLCERILFSFENVKPQPIAVGGPIYPMYESTPPKWFSDRFEIRSWGKDKKFLTPPRAKFGFSGANMAVQKRAFLEYGDFQTELGELGNKLMGEETELFMRIYEKEPYFWYDPEIKVWHWTPAKNFTFEFRYERAKLMGIALAAIEGRSWLKRTFWDRLGALVLSLFFLPFYKLTGNKQKSFLWIRKYGFSLGYFFGSQQ